MSTMQNTKLILLEGIPGSGKSTLAQFITQALIRQDIACQWWYEEEKNHPLYIFHDQTSLQDTIAALSDGHYRQVVASVLEQWKVFVQSIQSSETIVILDGCLFGYLTWSLFPLDIPVDEIRAYLSQVEQIIHPLQPCLIYLHQQKLQHALEKICQRRGGDTRSHLIDQATQSAYGKRQGLQGFDGMVRYWQDFRAFVEDVFSHFVTSKLTLENSAENWSLYEWSVLEFLGLPTKEQVAFSSSLLKHFVGTYSIEADEDQHACLVLLEEGHLIVDGIPQVWPKTRLIPLSHNMFAIASLPFQVAFEEDAYGVITGMRTTGPELLFGTADHFFVRVREP
jgi:thymidylate kinase